MAKKKKAQGLVYLKPDQIDRNPENPRLIFDSVKMQELQDSINEIGILVPLIVYYDDDREKYILLDGERRLKCARALKLNRVPVNAVAKPSRLQNILEMFNIHNVRIEWGPMEVAWKLKVIIDEFGYEKDKELARVTSLKLSEIRRSKILLSYAKKYQNLVHLGPREGGLKEDFLVELKPILKWTKDNLGYSTANKNRLTDMLIKKHRTGIIDNYVRGFRNLNKILKAKIPIEKSRYIVSSLAKDSKFNIDEAYETSIKYSVTQHDIEKRVTKLTGLLRDFKIKKEGTDLQYALRELLEVIKEKLKSRS